MFLLNRQYLIGLFALFTVSSSHAAFPTPPSPDEINILFSRDMNDISSDTKGGYAELAFLLKQQRKRPTPLFFFFGGGSIGPSKLSSFDRGTHTVDLLNSIEPDVMGITKRDFSFYEDELSLRSYEAAFPFVSSNVIEKETNLPPNGIESSVITKQQNIKVGVISTLEKSAVEEYNLKRIEVTDKIAAIKKQATHLRSKNVDLVVLMYSSIDTNISFLLEDGIVDLILQKDSHVKQRTNKINVEHPNYVYITNIDEVALVNIKGLNTKPKKLTVSQTFYKYNQLDKDSTMQAKVEEYKARLSSLLQEDIGITTTSFHTHRSSVRQQENEFGNLIADALREYTDADIAVINGGSIRGEAIYQENQKISRRDVISELPHRSYAVVLQLTGKQLHQAIEHSLSGVEYALGRLLQVSQLTIKYNKRLPLGERVLSIKHKGIELDPAKSYNVAMSNYLASGGDDYTMWEGAQEIEFSRQKNMLISDIVINYIRERGRIAPKVENRINELSDNKGN